MSTMDWILVAVQGLVVIGFIALGVRSGGIGLGLWGGVGTLVLVFVFGLDPGEPPIGAILIIIAVISAAAAMEAARGVDYMVKVASAALPAKPSMLNFAAPYVSYVLTILTGTGNTFFSIIPVINEIAYANKIRPERPLRDRRSRPLAGSPRPRGGSDGHAAASRRDLPLRPRRRPVDHDPGKHRRHLRDVARHEPPRQGPRGRRGVPAQGDRRRGDASRAGRRDRVEALRERSVAIFLAGVAAICVFGFVEDIRPTVAAEGGGVEPMSVTPLIQMIMLTAAALILVFAHVKATEIPLTSIFRSGMVAMIALFGIAWMADTFIADDEDAIVQALGSLAENWPFTIALAIFLRRRADDEPVGRDPHDGAARTRARHRGRLHDRDVDSGRRRALPAGERYADRGRRGRHTGTTTLGKRVVDHSFQLPLQVCWIVTALVGLVIVWLFFGGHTPAPPTPTTTDP